MKTIYQQELKRLKGKHKRELKILKDHEDLMLIAEEEFPTCEGMNRHALDRVPRSLRVPHMRGDEPAHGCLDMMVAMSSPHAWG